MQGRNKKLPLWLERSCSKASWSNIVSVGDHVEVTRHMFIPYSKAI